MMYPRRTGLYPLKVNEVVEVKVGQVGVNKFGKKQVSGFVGNEYYFLPTHTELVEQLLRVPEGETVKVKRLTLGNEKETAKYEIVKPVENRTGVTIKEEPETTDNASQVLNTVVSCLKNNCSSGQIIMILKKEFGEDALKEMGL